MTTIETLTKQLETVGLIALVPGELSNDRLLEVVDALLASPILAVQIVPNGPNTYDTVAAFRKRAGDNMLVGVDRVETLIELNDVIAAGAQFASSGGDFHLPLFAFAKKQDFMYIPTVHSPGQTLLCSRANAQWQKIRDDIDVEGLEGMMERSAELGYSPRYIINQLSIDNVDAAFEAGAQMACVNDIYLDDDQPMSDIILRARRARSLWLTASSGE